MDTFCELSGQKISLAKSKVYFSPNVSLEDREEMCGVLGFISTPNLGKYLGFPLRQPRSLSRDFNFVIERVQNKLQGWKACMLSMAGRITLSESAIFAIPSYVMQCCLLPSRVLNNLDKVNRNFIWGSSEDRKKIHMVSLDEVTKPKAQGGLGIKKAKRRNLTLAAKLCWRMEKSSNEGWAEVLKKKYWTGSSNRKGPRSIIWTAIEKGKKICEKGSKWILGNDSLLSFWDDKWLNLGLMRSFLEGPLNRGEDELLVKDVMINGCWSFENLLFNLPESVVEAIKATPIRRNSRNVDQKCWISSANGDIEPRNAYLIAIREDLSTPNFDGKWIRKTHILPKVQKILWKCLHQSLPVNAILEARGMEGLRGCSSCFEATKSISHVLRECPVAQSF